MTRSRLFRDPLVLFVLLGAGLAVLHTATRGEEAVDPEVRRIVVTDADVAWMVEAFQKTRMRPPTPEELTGLVRSRVREEMLYREALAMGLDEGDPAMRRRLARKVEYLVRDAGAAVDPTPSELQAWLDEHPDRYRRGPWRAFTQVFLQADERWERLEQEAEALLRRLRSERDVDALALGDPSLLEAEVPPSTREDVASFVQAHVVRGPWPRDALFGAEELETWDGREVPVETANGKLVVGGARILFTNERVRNGILHLVHPVVRPAGR